MDFLRTSEFWLIMGLALAFLELLVPGLVAVFVGLGAITVAVATYFGWINPGYSQFIVWFASSLVYIFSLRIFVLKLFPQAQERGIADEDQISWGAAAVVSTEIPAGNVGRIYYTDSTWPAKSLDNSSIPKGKKVRIHGRDNITYIVKAEKGES